ncbi:ATP-binding cassette domain-containing protein, partial [Candidatus Saccharibacteria bacterium]|nr:ATP-binding cassette domain-containing protein [Candidatus Saccharibacteria bacterium]
IGRKPQAKGEAIIKTENLTKIYGRGPAEVRALDGVNLTVRKGEFFVVMGPSGSGKTTLLNMLGALDKPSWGEVFLDEIQISKVPERKLYKVRREKVG